MRFFQACTMLLISIIAGAQSLPFAHLHTYKTGIFDGASTQVLAYDRTTFTLYSTNKSTNEVDIILYKNLLKPQTLGHIDISPYAGEVNSVAVHFGIVAVVASSVVPQSPGKLLFFDKDGLFLGQFEVGASPQQVVFTYGGNRVLVAGAGEPSDDYTGDPWGSISMLDISPGFGNVSQSDMQTIYFDKLDTTAYDPMVRVFGNSGKQTPSQDLEPESMVVNSDYTKAYVMLQENNAMGIIDLSTFTVDTVIGLGYKDFTSIGIDVSDSNQVIDIKPRDNLFGMYQPDGSAIYKVNGKEYILTANEGAPREYSGYSEVGRIKDFPLNTAYFPSWPGYQSDTSAGRLHVTITEGDYDKNYVYDSLMCFGARSFSIWDSTAQLVWDSGDDFEQTLALLHASSFNSESNSNSSRKTRSDDMGPEPQGIVVGEVEGKTYAFIGLSQMGGIMIYDITNPMAPQFVMYELNRDFSKAANDPEAGDLGPDGLVFVAANHNKRKLPLLYVANGVSGTITVYEMGTGVGLSEFEDVEAKPFYPNPSEGIFYSDLKSNYEVYNSSGMLIQTIENKNQIDLTNEAPGFYLIKSTDGSSYRVIKK